MKPAIAEHVSWDYGAVSSLFVQLLKPKTRKTLCGKQVAFRNTTDLVGAASCPQCLKKHRENEASASLLERIRR